MLKFKTVILSTLNNLLVLVSFVALAVLIKIFVFDDYLHSSEFNQLLTENYQIAAVYFFMITIGATMIGLPRQAMAFIGGFTFGAFNGIVLATLGTTLGCMLCFFFARFIARDFLRQKFRLKVEKVDRFLRQDTFAKTLVIRLLPVGSNLLTNIAAGLTAIKKLPFFAASFIGYLPQMIIFGLSGSGVRMDSNNQLVTSFVLLIISVLIGLWLVSKYKTSHYLSNQ